MKVFHRRVLGIFMTSLFIVAAASGLFAGQENDRAGYQGIPVRNGLNRGVIQHDDSSATTRYSNLPRRPNEADIAPGSYQAQNKQDRGGYTGIPQHTSYASETRRDENSDGEGFERAGYAGIPQRLAPVQKTIPGNSLAAKRSSALVGRK